MEDEEGKSDLRARSAGDGIVKIILPDAAGGDPRRMT